MRDKRNEYEKKIKEGAGKKGEREKQRENNLMRKDVGKERKMFDGGGRE